MIRRTLETRAERYRHYGKPNLLHYLNGNTYHEVQIGPFVLSVPRTDKPDKRTTVWRTRYWR